MSELEERIRLIDRCASQAKFHYHVLGELICLYVGHPRVQDPFGMSHMMSKGERWRVIIAGKCTEETGVAQVSKEVLRPKTSVPNSAARLPRSGPPDASGPLSFHLQMQPIPDKFKVLGMPVFGPSSDPMEHEVNYNICKDLHTMSEGLKCRAFSANLNE
ncbi:hypothetical protein ACLOJK_034407 [Asimina triloba]